MISLRRIFLFFTIYIGLIAQIEGAFPWIRERSQIAPPRSDFTSTSKHRAEYGTEISNKFAITLSQLRDLESEPLCHRIASRLLIHNCHLLDGSNDATIHTDSGRERRDFVDFYAASLAICDLERGSFVIPSSCSQFREPVLAQIPPLAEPKLHVSSSEVDDCLEGLAQSDSAWSTWVSYRHKALGFCEAAQIENEKDKNIRVFEKITEIISKLTTDVEEDIKKGFEAMNRAAQKTSKSLESLNPQISNIKESLIDLEESLVGTYAAQLRASQEVFQAHLRGAKDLDEKMATIYDKLEKQQAEYAASHEVALHSSSAQFKSEAEVMMSSLTAVSLTAASLRTELETSNELASKVAARQEVIEAGMERLEGVAGRLLEQQNSQQNRLERAQQTTKKILVALESISASSNSFHASFFGITGWTEGLWPYVVCPLVSLTVGSYGLPPSAQRNIVLLGLGEIVGFVISMTTKATAKSEHLDSSNITTTQDIASDDFVDLLKTREKEGTQLDPGDTDHWESM